jgi:DNA-directed RNA polymerase specialized sigma24 family protein
VLMRVWDGLSYAEIAAVLGKGESACKMAFSRAVAELRKRAPLAALLLILLHPLR